jgi:hypothetical protein
MGQNGYAAAGALGPVTDDARPGGMGRQIILEESLESRRNTSGGPI